MDLGLSRPSIPTTKVMNNCQMLRQGRRDLQKANGYEQRPDDQGRDSHLRFSNAVVLSSIVGIYPIREPYAKHRSKDKPNAEADVGNTGGSDPESVGMGEKLWRSFS